VPRTSAEARASTRARLLEAAAAAFAREGLDGANINEISLAAGFAKGTVYNYFASKETLFLAVVEEACARTVEGAERPEAGTRARLRALLAADVAWAHEQEAFARVLVRELFSAKPELYERVVAAAAPFIGRVVEILAEGVRRGEVRADLPVERLALLFTGLGELALVAHWGSGGAWPALEEIPEFVVDLFLEGAEPRAEGL
jgi:AcrR family transcriptional regulator